jgi:hypothetical protein
MFLRSFGIRTRSEDNVVHILSGIIRSVNCVTESRISPQINSTLQHLVDFPPNQSVIEHRFSGSLSVDFSMIKTKVKDSLLDRNSSFGKITLLTCQAGMGKSFVTKQLYDYLQNNVENFFFVYVKLADHCNFFYEEFGQNTGLQQFLGQ